MMIQILIKMLEQISEIQHSSNSLEKFAKSIGKISLSMQNFIATQFKIMAKVEKAIFFRIIGLKSMTISVPESSRATIKESELQNWCSLFLT